MPKQTEKQSVPLDLRAFWLEEVYLWKTTRDITWARWCQGRDLDPKEMPRPLDPIISTTTEAEVKPERKPKKKRGN